MVPIAAFTSNDVAEIEFYISKKESREIIMLEGGASVIVERVVSNLGYDTDDIPRAIISVRAVAN